MPALRRRAALAWAAGGGAPSAVPVMPAPAAPELRSDGNLPAVGGDGPDHKDIQGDDQQRPERVVGKPQEDGDGTQYGHGDPNHPGPGLSRQQPPAGEAHQQANQQVDPAPGGGVELEQVVAGGDVELVLEDGEPALQRPPDT